MDYFDFIKELRKGEPNPKKAEKAMKILGWICIFGEIWNFVLSLWHHILGLVPYVASTVEAGLPMIKKYLNIKVNGQPLTRDISSYEVSLYLSPT